MNKEDRWTISPDTDMAGIPQEHIGQIEDYLTYRRFTKGREITTVSNEQSLLIGFARFVGNQPFKSVGARDMQEFFKTIPSASRDLYGTKIIQFYRYTFNLKRRERHKNMEWFEYRTKAEKVKNTDPQAFKKYFVTAEQYREIQRVTIDLQTKALWETMYLSGARPGEICSMTIESIIEGVDGIEITVWDSKTVPRNIPLPDYPKHLLHWFEIHPDRDNKKSKMWFSLSRRDYGKPLRDWSIIHRLDRACRFAKIDRHKPHDFRKTRATIMFEKNFDDKMMAEYFGWQVETVAERRNQYDLRGYKELKDKIFNGSTPPETTVELKQERDVKIRQLEQQIGNMSKFIDRMLTTVLGKEEIEKIKKEFEQE